jgi:hypothetical protein
MVMLRVGVKRKTLQLQSCREFHGKRSGHKIQLIPSPDGRVRPNLLRPKMGRRESERLYKGGTLARGRHLHPRICSHQSHVFASRAPRCSSPPSSPLSPSPIPPIMQWFILPHTSVPSYINMVFDAIIFILWSMPCLHSLFVLRLICWMSLVH